MARSAPEQALPVPPCVVDEEAVVRPVASDSVHAPERPAPIASVAMLAPEHRERSMRAKADFAAGGGADAGERLLQELVAGEVGVALQLVDVEAGLAMVLSRTIDNPELAGAVARVFKETVHLSAAVRRRMESCLEAAAMLRAQRILSMSRRLDDV